MAQVVVVTSGKGGVGKTTSTAAMGAALAHFGEKVAVIDFDVVVAVSKLDEDAVLDALDDERQLALEHEVDLLLALVGMDPPALARLQDDEVHPE